MCQFHDDRTTNPDDFKACGEKFHLTPEMILHGADHLSDYYSRQVANDVQALKQRELLKELWANYKPPKQRFFSMANFKVSGRTVTTLVLLFCVAGLIAYDFFAVWRWGFDATISLVVFTTAKEWPLLPFLTGLICGHFFFPVQGVKNGE